MVYLWKTKAHHSQRIGVKVSTHYKLPIMLVNYPFKHFPQPYLLVSPYKGHTCRVMVDPLIVGHKRMESLNLVSISHQGYKGS